MFRPRSHNRLAARPSFFPHGWLVGLGAPTNGLRPQHWNHQDEVPGHLSKSKKKHHSKTHEIWNLNPFQAKKPPTNLFNPHLLRHPAGAALGAAALGAAALGALGAGAGGTGAATRAAATGGAAGGAGGATGVGTGGAAGGGTDLSTGGAPVCGKPRRAAASWLSKACSSVSMSMEICFKSAKPSRVAASTKGAAWFSRVRASNTIGKTNGFHSELHRSRETLGKTQWHQSWLLPKALWANRHRSLMGRATNII